MSLKHSSEHAALRMQQACSKLAFLACMSLHTQEGGLLVLMLGWMGQWHIWGLAWGRGQSGGCPATGVTYVACTCMWWPFFLFFRTPIKDEFCPHPHYIRQWVGLNYIPITFLIISIHTRVSDRVLVTMSDNWLTWLWLIILPWFELGFSYNAIKDCIVKEAKFKPALGQLPHWGQFPTR